MDEMEEVDTLVTWTGRYKPDPEPGEIWHKWLGLNDPQPWDDTKLLVLCWKVTGEKPAEFETAGEGYVTLYNAKVTCQECSELIHA